MAPYHNWGYNSYKQGYNPSKTHLFLAIYREPHHSIYNDRLVYAHLVVEWIIKNPRLDPILVF